VYSGISLGVWPKAFEESSKKEKFLAHNWNFNFWKVAWNYFKEVLRKFEVIPAKFKILKIILKHETHKKLSISHIIEYSISSHFKIICEGTWEFFLLSHGRYRNSLLTCKCALISRVSRGKQKNINIINIRMSQKYVEIANLFLCEDITEGSGKNSFTLGPKSHSDHIVGDMQKMRIH
jgi:hypothetical protein